MLNIVLFISAVLSITSLTITEPADEETYDGDWLTIRVIVENENELPDSVLYTLNGEPTILVPRLNTDWPTYMQNNQNQGYSESPAPTDNSILWTAPVTGQMHEFPTPVVVDGTVFYTADSCGEGTADSLYALNAVTGELIWKYDTGSADDAVTVSGGFVYSAADSIFCIDALTGLKIWASGEADGGGSTPLVADGRVFCGTYWIYAAGYVDSSKVCCLDAGNGEVLWADTVYGNQASCMALWDDLVILPTNEGYLYALDSSTGNIVWENNDSQNGYWDSSPAIVDGIIYINGFDGVCRGINAASGLTIWETPLTPGGLYDHLTATPACFGGSIFFGNQTDAFYCIDTASGNLVWNVAGNQHGSPGIADGMVFYGEHVAVDDSARVVALDMVDGSEVWSYRTACSFMGFQGSPSITDGIVYYPCTDGKLYAFGSGLKFTYRDDLYASVGTNELIATSFFGGTAVAADTVSFTVAGTGINLAPSSFFNLSASPNPFVSMASISFNLSEQGFTSVEIFDLAGRRIVTLVNSELSAGTHSVNWSGAGTGGETVSAGLYLCRIHFGDVSETAGLCLLR